MTSKYTDAAEQGLKQDFDPESKAKLQEVINNNDEKALEQAFAERLSFGTAGLRGLMGVGPGNMNVGTRCRSLHCARRADHLPNQSVSSSGRQQQG